MVDDDEQGFPDYLAQRISAATYMIANLDKVNKKSEHYCIGIDILTAFYLTMLPEEKEKDGKLLAFKGGKS